MRTLECHRISRYYHTAILLRSFSMPVTRSIARSSRVKSDSIDVPTTRTPSRTPGNKPPALKKRTSEEAKSSECGLSVLPKVKRARSSKTSVVHQHEDVPTATRIPIVIEPNATLIPAQLSFSFVDAKNHLIAADSRFNDMFANVKCKPFEILEPLDPFR